MAATSGGGLEAMLLGARLSGSVPLVRAAHELGVHDLAMEALPAPAPGAPESWTALPPVKGGYLA